MKDPARNGRKSLHGVIDHLETPLVKWAQHAANELR
jgi:hypothetical protein